MSLLRNGRAQIAIAAIVALIILAVAFGWLGGSGPPATTPPAPTQ